MIENLRHREKTPRAPGENLKGEPLNIELIQSSLSSCPNQQTKASQGLESKTYIQHQRISQGQASFPGKPANWPSKQSPPNDSNKTAYQVENFR